MKFDYAGCVDGRCVVSSVAIAQNPLSRARGLLFSQPLLTGQGLWITRCSSVHTCFMTYAIHVVFLNRHHEVIEIEHNLKPWRMAFSRRASSVLELAATADVSEVVSLGDTLCFTRRGQI